MPLEYHHLAAQAVSPIDFPGRFRARVTFRRFYFKRGKMSRWFWTAESAAKVS
jgi:hypothetical protein